MRVTLANFKSLNFDLKNFFQRHSINKHRNYSLMLKIENHSFVKIFNKLKKKKSFFEGKQKIFIFSLEE